MDAADADAPSDAARVALSRQAAFAANACNKLETARRFLVPYVEQRPDDLDAQRELAALHRRAGALEPLGELLGTLWRRLPEPEQGAALREHAALSLELKRDEAALAALRHLLARDPHDTWAARALLPLLPPVGQATAPEEDERLALYTALVSQTQGEEAADWLARRAELHRAMGRLADARTDYAEAARASAQPRELLRQVAELAREADDAPGELAAWKAALARAPELGEVAAGRLLALARARLAASDFPAAREGFAAAAALPLGQDDRCEAWSGLAEAALALGDRPAAAAAWSEAAGAGPARRRLDALLRRAELLEADGHLPDAAQALERALLVSPRHPAATDAYRRVLRALGSSGCSPRCSPPRPPPRPAPRPPPSTRSWATCTWGP